MPRESSDDLTDEERALFGAYDVAADLAARCRRLRQMNVSVSEDALDRVVDWLMTEFWDQSFSQTEIRKAFTAALADPNRYAAGEERRWPHPAFDALIGTVPNRPAFHRPLESLHLRVETTIEAIDEKGLVRIADRVVPGGGRLAARRSCG